ncbi:MAG: hypothetical protein DDT27_00242 [Dehalococcoidia bacterium]|nr:hypothetical protein [Chloroflexota bacterium]MBT9161705.1 hypothetical protein [Chloroflexota bacterium]
MAQGNNTRRMVRLALMVSLATIIWVVEAALPVPVPVPGAKLGLANAIVLWCVIAFGFRDALMVNLLRVVLGALLTGTFMNVSFFLSLAGGTASVLVMGLLWTTSQRWVSIIGVSLAGAFTHNLAQILTASVLIGHPAILMYLPFLLFFALPTGFFVGLLVSHLGRISLWGEPMVEALRIKTVKGREAVSP